MTSTKPNKSKLSLTGQILIAMPDMNDPRFFQSVVLICSHDESGAMGVIINKPSPELTEHQLMHQIDIPADDRAKLRPVMFGGPVDMTHGFVVHSDDGQMRSRSTSISSGIALTATLDILHDIAKNQGPTNHMLALGYAGWSPGQIEAELMQNGWLTTDSDPELVFHIDHDKKWTAALAKLGVDPLMLSADAGRA
jgi:putative transcriptional regulator